MENKDSENEGNKTNRKKVKKSNRNEVNDDNRNEVNKDNQNEVNKDHLHEKQFTFKDGVRTIDFVLVWDSRYRRSSLPRRISKREIFESNLKAEGLQLEHELEEETGITCVKIHAPLDVLQRYAQILKLRMPMKDLDELTYQDDSEQTCSCWRSCISSCFTIDPDVFPECERKLTATYSRAREYLFDSHAPGFFRPANKARIVLFILERTLYSKPGESNVFEFGIDRLVLSNVYAAAYPLHDGDLDTEGSMRYRFYHYWASFSNWCRIQPLDHIQQYFGVKIALYFTWLGFYTYMLAPAGIVGLISFVLSLLLLPGDVPTDEICSGSVAGEVCPLCDNYCNFWKVTESCAHIKILFIFDNTITVLFAIFMSFWAAVFLEFWKRYVAEITLRWDMTWFDSKEENPRPEYAARLSRMVADNKIEHKLNFITNAFEPSLSFWGNIFPAKALSYITVVLLVTLAIATVIGVTIYHIFALASLSVFGKGSVITRSAIAIASTTSASLNLCCIFLFSWIYSHVARCLTEMELPRTQREFDSSLTLKMFLLEFVNNYSSIFYIAFFKGKFAGIPSGYNRIFGYRQLECGPGGCMLELTIQLATIMIGKRAFKSLLEYLSPVISQKLKSHHWRKLYGDIEKDMDQWEKDFLLTDGGPRFLFPEYLDMVLQYGFVTIFVCAFPLAPLFAFLNNIFEIRIDAQKLLIYYRRPGPKRAKDIGVWYDILSFISKMAVFSNGIIIAFTSDFVPRLVYKMSVSPDQSLAGYMNYSLAYVSIKDLNMEGKPDTTEQYCRYMGYREPPWSSNKYHETMMFWKVLAARLAFFIIFENVIVVAVHLLKWIIPDVPQKLQWEMRRTAFLTNETIIKHEAKRTRSSGANFVSKDEGLRKRSVLEDTTPRTRFVPKAGQ